MDDYLFYIFALLVWGVPALVKALRGNRPQKPAPPRRPAQPRPAQPRPARPQPAHAAEHARGRGEDRGEDRGARERQQQAQQLDEVIARMEELSRSARVDRATVHLAEVMDDEVLPRARSARSEIAAGAGRLDFEERAAVQEVWLMSRALELFVNQRRSPRTRQAVIDADAMAEACYRPIIDFARTNRFELTSSRPVTALGPRDLAIWTSFKPTGVAPIFLPPAFLQDVRWWPGLAHEIGHDMLASIHGAGDMLRQELGLPPEQAGRRPLFVVGGLHMREIYRVYGGFFDELFCDVVGTMMLGPAYGYTMVELFAEPQAPQRTAMVTLDKSRRYELHPPRLLRVLMVAHVLELVGEDEAAEDIRAEWEALHGPQDTVLFETDEGMIGVPLAVLDGVLAELAAALYSEGSQGLDGHALADIPGLAYGPHMAADVRQARDELLAGRVPARYGARDVVAATVLAWREARDRHDELVALALRAIVGVTETREDIYDRTLLEPAAEVRRIDDVREAVLLHVLLAPPPGARAARHQGGPRSRRGFLDRPRWP